MVAKKHATTCDQILEIVEMCSDACRLRWIAMSCAAKSHHIMAAGDRDIYGADQISPMAERFGWKVSTEDMRDGANLLRALKLAR